MEEFAKLIFEQWVKENDYNVEWFTNKGRTILDEAEKVLNVDLVDRIYELLCDNGEELMQQAFTAGFGYACKCLSNGKIEFSK